jgi:hypothetical protein
MITIHGTWGRLVVAATIATATIGLACADETFVGATVRSEQSLTTRSYIVGDFSYFWVKDDLNSLVIRRDTTDGTLLPATVTQGQSGGLQWLTATLASTNVMDCRTHENTAAHPGCDDCCSSCSPCQCVTCTVKPRPQPTPGGGEFPWQTVLSIGPGMLEGF